MRKNNIDCNIRRIGLLYLEKNISLWSTQTVYVYYSFRGSDYGRGGRDVGDCASIILVGGGVGGIVSFCHHRKKIHPLSKKN